MHIDSKPHVARQEDRSGPGSGFCGGEVATKQTPTSDNTHRHKLTSSPRIDIPSPHSPLLSSHARTSVRRGTNSVASAPSKLVLSRSSDQKRESLPFTFPPLFPGPANASSTSLAPSTAEGRPIPLDDTTTRHRTTALRVLNSAYPSRINHHPSSTKSTGARSTTYSQPVLVRTYSGPSHSQSPFNATSHRYRPPPNSDRAESRRVVLPAITRAGSFVSERFGKVSPFATRGTNGSTHGSLGNEALTMPGHGKGKKSSSRLALNLPWNWASASSSRSHPGDVGSLPPIEAFSFKTMMATEDTGGRSIGSDLDRIAEILERSKYSLSNQYEVHVAPHGSGASFVSDVASTHGARSSRRKGHRHSRSVGSGGPTLQAIGPDDERRRHRGPGRRRSVAYGTLETIMSSSGSSSDAKSKKKPAAEIAAEVRGRAAAKKDPHSSGGSGTQSGSTFGSGAGAASNAANCSSGTADTGKTPDDNSSHDLEQLKLARKKSTSFATAVISSHSVSKDVTSPRGSTAALLSEPARPRTSKSHIEIQTAEPGGDSTSSSGASSPAGTARKGAETHAKLETHLEQFPRIPNSTSSGSLLSSLSYWVPWKTPSGGEHSRPKPPLLVGGRQAEGSLRQLLQKPDIKSTDKGKGVMANPEP